MSTRAFIRHSDFRGFVTLLDFMSIMTDDCPHSTVTCHMSHRMTPLRERLDSRVSRVGWVHSTCLDSCHTRRRERVAHGHTGYARGHAMKSRRSVLPHEVLHRDPTHFRAAPLPRLASSPLLHGPYRSIRDDRQQLKGALDARTSGSGSSTHKRRSCEFDGRRGYHRAASKCLPPPSSSLRCLGYRARQSIPWRQPRGEGCPQTLGRCCLGAGLLRGGRRTLR